MSSGRKTEMRAILVAASKSSVLFWAIFSAILCLGILFWGWYEVNSRLGLGYGISVDKDLIRLDIGDKKFQVPKNYIWSKEDWRGGQVSGANLHAMYPSLQPPTVANKSQFERPDSQTVLILIEEHAMPPSQKKTGHVSMTRKEVFARITRQQSLPEVAGPNGLRRLVFPASSQPISKELFVGNKSGGDFYWVTCPLAKSMPNPLCSTFVEYSSNVYIKYSFPMQALSNWDALDDDVRKLITSFEINN